MNGDNKDADVQPRFTLVVLERSNLVRKDFDLYEVFTRCGYGEQFDGWHSQTQLTKGRENRL